MAGANLSGPTRRHTKDIGKIIRCMERANSLGQMAGNTKESIKVISNMGMEKCAGPITKCIMESGEKGSSVVKECTGTNKECGDREPGSMAN